MATLSQIIKDKNDRLSQVPDEFLTQVEKVQKSIFTEFLTLAETIDRKGGFIVGDAKNINKIAVIIEDLRSVLAVSEYPDIVQKFVNEFGVQKILNDTYFEKAFSEFGGSTFADAVLKKSQQDAIQAFLGSPIDSDFLQPIEKLLTDSIMSGAGWRDTVVAIRQNVEGGGGYDGRLLSYSKQIAHDQFAFADRSYSNAISDELENEWFILSGSIIATSRCVCRKFHQEVFHFKEIEGFARGEGLGDCKVDGLWAGAVPDTNEQTIFIYCFGFNCRHNWLPISVFSVPKNVIERNILSGNYKPDKAEVEALGL